MSGWTPRQQDWSRPRVCEWHLSWTLSRKHPTNFIQDFIVRENTLYKKIITGWCSSTKVSKLLSLGVELNTSSLLCISCSVTSCSTVSLWVKISLLHVELLGVSIDVKLCILLFAFFSVYRNEGWILNCIKCFTMFAVKINEKVRNNFKTSKTEIL